MQIETAIYPSLKDKPIFITGGGSGIGASIVEHFCAQNAKVAFVDIAAAESAALAESISRRGLPKPLFIACDLRDIAALQAAIARTESELGLAGQPRASCFT